MTNLTSLTNNQWYSIKGDQRVKELYDKFISELNIVRQNIIKNLEKMELESIKKYESMSGIPYSEKIKQFDFEKLKKIQDKIKELKTTKMLCMEVSQWCFENLGLEDVEEEIKNRALYYFDLYYE